MTTFLYGLDHNIANVLHMYSKHCTVNKIQEFAWKGLPADDRGPHADEECKTQRDLPTLTRTEQAQIRSIVGSRRSQSMREINRSKRRSSMRATMSRPAPVPP